MAYSQNPHLPRLRMEAVRLVKYRGWSTRRVARYTGFSQSAITKWCTKDETGGWVHIPTKSSKPRTHPRQLEPAIVSAIVAERLKHGRCAEVIHAALIQRGISVSLSSVKRTLARHELIKSRTKWHRKRRNIPRPEVTVPGSLLQVDTIHLFDLAGTKHYVYTIIDLYSRWAYAEAAQRITQANSYDFVRRAERAASFTFVMLQADNGPEFGKNLHDRLGARNITLRHSRVRRSNDNAHIERFNRTIQEESLGKWPSHKTVRAKIPKFLQYYNQERLHMGINYKTPNQVLK